MRKRIIALLLALILTVGLLPTVALAAGETENNDVVPGKYVNGVWTKGDLTQTLPAGVKSINKTATKTGDNTYEVTLEVVLQQTEENSGKAATVLVLDTSGSMAYCAECGVEPDEDCEHNYVPVLSTPSETGTYYYKYTNKNGQVEFGKAHYCNGQHTFKEDHPAGWFKTKWYESDHNTQGDALSANDLYRKKPRASRLDAAKVGAENFLKTYSGLTFKTDGTVAANQNSRNLGRYVSVVSFATGAALKQEWVDVSNSDVYQKVLKNIKGLSAEGGTNLDAGLTYAEYLLNADKVNGAVKNVIALTDGQPTFFIDTNMNAYDDDGLKYLNREFLTIDKKQYRVHGTGDSCNEKTFTETVASADAVKNHAKLYTVCFDADETIGVPNSKDQITVSAYLSTRIATQPTKTGEQFAYDADNAEKLYVEFAKITQSIVSGLSTGTVKDTLPTGITSTAFETASVEWDLVKDFHPESVTKQEGEKQVTTYTYTKTYTVTIDPKTVKTEKVDGVDYAPLNGKTTLTVKNSQGTDVEIPFPIPAGKVTFPQTTYTLNYDLNGGDANTLITQQTATTAEEKHTFTIHNVTPTREGYTFAGWTESQTPTAEDTRYQPNHRIELTKANNTKTLYAQWTPATNTGYTVEHYLQKLEGDGYTKQETEELTGTTGENVNAAPKSYTGFTCDEKVEGTIKSGTIAADGSLVLKLYYTRNSYTVTYTDGVDGAEVFADDEHNNVAYGDTIPVFTNGTPTREGYNFIGWASSVEGVTPSSAMPASNVTFTAQWKEKDKVTINYVAKTGGSVTLANETLNPDTGVAVGSTATASTGYRFVGWYDNSECTGTALSKDASYTPSKPEAGWADKTYYAKFESLTYTITFKTENGGTINDQTNDITHPGLTAGTTFPAVPTTKANTGYYFLGWYDESGNKVEENAFPEKVTGNATYTAKWLSYNSINLDLTGKIQKTLNSDVELSNQSFTINVKQTGAEAASATATATVSATTASGTGYTGSAPFQTATDEFKLPFTAPGTYNYSIVEEQPVRPGMTYDDGFATTGHTMTVVVEEDAAHALSVTSVTVDSNAIDLTATGATWLTITNTYTEPKEPRVVSKKVVTTDAHFPGGLDTAIDEFKSKCKIEKVLYPTGDGTTNNTLEVPYGTDSVTLLYAITVNRGTESNTMDFDDNGATFVFAVDADVAPGSHDHFDVIFNDGISTAVIYVAKTHTPLNFVGGKCTVENVISKEVKATTTVTEKDPDKLYLDFSKYVQKELAATGSKTASDVSFRVIVNGMESPIMMYNAGEEEVSTYVEFDPRYSTVLDVNFASITGGSTETKDFTGSYVEIDQVGIYYFELNEEDGKRTGVTYDDSTYKVYVYVKREGDKLVVGSFDIYKDGLSVAGETITFHNTIDTGRDDYIPIIIPTIINKDTGMLNKTDHFAYVIGYPDGTVHPNGQITRAEVATIFFRLLKDEVRDGAFTTSNSYSDVAYGKWYNNPISTMSALGIITGYPDGTFKPNKPITRAEFAAIAARFDETQSGKSATFSDVIGHWAAKEIGIAYANEWIKGYPDGTFKPDQNITRAEAMTMINRVLERKPESPADLLTNMNKWTDNMDTSKWYYLDVQEATNSHAYTRKTFNYELWRQMLPDPDWSRYER